MRLLICAGGTGGGVYPALTVLQTMKAEGSTLKPGAPHEPNPSENAPGSSGKLHPLWVGGIGGMEAELVKRAGIPFQSIPAAGVHGVGLRAMPGNLVKLAAGLKAARGVVRDFRPDVLLFTGGYVAVPVALAARLPFSGRRLWGKAHNKRLPIVLYVPDIEPGWALKALAPLADHIAITVEQTRQYLPSRIPVTVSGYPVRPDLQVWDEARARQVLGLSSDAPILLASGGSRGARPINRALLNVLPELLAEMQVIHLTGQGEWQEVENSWRSLSAGLPAELAARYHPYPFLHQEMGAAMSLADLVLSRAGASCLGEYPQFGLPAILVPYPYAWRYQNVNAGYLVERGAAVLLSDDALATRLLPVVSELMKDQPRRLRMQHAMHSLSRPRAAEEIAALLYGLANGYAC